MVNDRLDIHTQSSESVLKTNNDGMVIHVTACGMLAVFTPLEAKAKPNQRVLKLYSVY